MNEMARLLLMLGLAGTAVTFLGSAAIWFMDEERRLRRALRKVLRAEPEAMIVAHGRGRGAGFSFSTGLCAVAWDNGGWLLVYRIDELTGTELWVDDEVVGRVYRGEPRRALDRNISTASRVMLRLIFDDPRHPDFELDLWLAGDESRRNATSPGKTIAEANQWLLRAEAITRRPAAPRAHPPESRTPEAAPPPAPSPPPPPPPARNLDEGEQAEFDI